MMLLFCGGDRRSVRSSWDKFKNPNVEIEYVKNLSYRTARKVRRYMKTITFVFVASSFRTFLDSDYLAAYGCIVMSISSFMIYIMTLTSWGRLPGRLEMATAILCVEAALNFSFMQSGRTTYKTGGLPCNDSLQKNDLEIFCLLMGIWPCIVGFMAIEIEILRYAQLKLIFVSMMIFHAIRTQFVHPVSDPVAWIIIIYCGILPVLITSARLNEKRKRELFVLEKQLREENADLVLKLDAAKQALAFELPTKEEASIVQESLGDATCDEDRVGFSKGVTHIDFDGLELHELIGFGAFGEVIKATYAGSTVAVKRMLRCRINKDNISLFRMEIEMCAQLRHPNVVNFLGASWNNPANLCIVLEYLPRGSLRTVLRLPEAELQLTWEDPKLRMLTDVVSGLTYLHSLHPAIIHRDLKSDNALVTSTFSCKLADFGASAKQDSERTMTQIGTLNYMAPEMIIGSRYDERADIFSLGILIWEVHTQRDPYGDLSGEHSDQKFFGLLLEGLRPTFPADTPPAIERLAESCWQREPHDRPTAASVWSTLSSLDGRRLTTNFLETSSGSSQATLRGTRKLMTVLAEPVVVVESTTGSVAGLEDKGVGDDAGHRGEGGGSAPSAADDDGCCGDGGVIRLLVEEEKDDENDDDNRASSAAVFVVLPSSSSGGGGDDAAGKKYEEEEGRRVVMKVEEYYDEEEGSTCSSNK